MLYRKRFGRICRRIGRVMSLMFSALTLYWVGAFSSILGVFRRCFGLCKFWGEFYNCGFDIVGAVLRLELVPVVEVGHHAAHNLVTVGTEGPFHVLEVLDALEGGVEVL